MQNLTFANTGELQDQPIRVRLEALGGEFRVFINGRLIGRLIDNHIGKPGVFGLIASSVNETENTATFSDLRVHEFLSP